MFLTLIIGDGNCLYRAISHFLFGHQLMFNDIRNEIYNIANSRKNLIPDVIIETSNGNMRIHDYINSIKLNKFHGDNFELLIAYDIYSFNIA